MLGPEHNDTADVLDGLATCLQQKEKYDDAEKLFRRSLAICEKSRGPVHPQVSISLNNLGNLLSDKASRSLF